MLKVKSFPITDADGVNDLLTKFPLAKGMHILVSEGHIMLPYEDGQPETTAVKIALIGEQKNKIIAERDIIEHSQGVVELLIADAKERIQVAQNNSDQAEASADKKKFNVTVKQELRQKLAEANSALLEISGQHRMNAHEIIRLNVNLEKFDEQIKKLSA